MFSDFRPMRSAVGCWTDVRRDESAQIGFGITTTMSCVLPEPLPRVRALVHTWPERERGMSGGIRQMCSQVPEKICRTYAAVTNRRRREMTSLNNNLV